MVNSLQSPDTGRFSNHVLPHKSPHQHCPEFDKLNISIDNSFGRKLLKKNIPRSSTSSELPIEQNNLGFAEILWHGKRYRHLGKPN